MRFYGIAFSIMCCAFSLKAQQVVNGEVTNEQGEPLKGALVVSENTDKGTTTGTSGQFELSIIGESDHLIVSHLGFETQKIPVSDGFIRVRLMDNYQLEAIVISSVRADDEPVSYSTINKKELKDAYNGEQPIFIIEEQTPSIFSYSESGTRLANYGNIRLRGMDQSRINMTLNGVPLNDMIDHGVFFSNFTDIGNSIASIQVQRGVGTSSNGVASYAGSINFESTNLRDQTRGGSMEVGIGSFGTQRLNTSASTGMIDEKWAAYASYSRLSSDGYRRNTFTEANSFFLSLAYFGEKDFLKLTIFDANSRNGLGYSNILESDLLTDPRTNYLNENDQDDFGQQLVQIQHTREFNERLSLTSSLYYGGSGGDYLYTYPVSDSTLQQINYPLTNRHYGIMSNLFWNKNNLGINLGLHGYVFNRENEESFSPDFANPYYEEQSSKKEWSVFSKFNYRLGALTFFTDLQIRSTRLIIDPDYAYIGIEPEGDIKKSWTFFNPKFGMNYQMTSNLMAYASLGRSGREPTKVDLFGGAFQLNMDNLEVARGSDFKAEYVNDLELGLRYLSKNWRLSGNYFYMDFQNEISPLGEVVAFGVQKRTNIKNSYRTGIEIDGAFSPIPEVTLQSHITYMKSRIDLLDDLGSGETYTDVSPVLSPNWIYGGQLSYMPWQTLQLGLTYRGISESYLSLENDEGLVLPAYAVAGARVGWTYQLFDIKLEINNLFDKQYYSNGSPVDVDFDGVIDGPGYIISAGRNYFLTTRLTF